MTNAEILRFFRQQWNIRKALDRDWRGRKRIIVGYNPVFAHFEEKARRILTERGKNEIHLEGFTLRLEWNEYSPIEGTLVFDHEPLDPRQLEFDFRVVRLVRRES